MTRREKFIAHLKASAEKSTDQVSISYLIKHVGIVEAMTDDEFVRHEEHFTSIIRNMKDVKSVTHQLRSYIDSLC